MTDKLILERRDRVLVATINDPAARNALSPEFYRGFREAVEQAGADPAIGAIVVTGAEGFFCAGGNVNGLKQRSESDCAARRSVVDMLHAMIRAMRACPKPIIAAVEGGAAGAGAALAAACDMVVAARDAYFSVAYIRIGLTPDGGTTAFLGAALPRQLVSEMVFTGERIAAERLYALGMVNRITAPGQALGTATGLAKRLGEGPAQALAEGKRLIAAARANSLEAQLEAEAEAIARALGGAEGREGINAFLEKRKPDFRNLP